MLGFLITRAFAEEFNDTLPNIVEKHVLENVPITVYNKTKYSRTIHRWLVMKFAKAMDCLYNLVAQDNSENF